MTDSKVATISKIAEAAGTDSAGVNGAIQSVVRAKEAVAKDADKATELQLALAQLEIPAERKEVKVLRWDFTDVNDGRDFVHAVYRTRLEAEQARFAKMTAAADEGELSPEPELAGVDA